MSNWYLANQEGKKNIKMHEIENIEIILLCSAIQDNMEPLQTHQTLKDARVIGDPFGCWL